MRRIVTIVAFMSCTLGSAFAQADLSKYITGNQDSPEALAAIHYGREGKLIWIFYHAPSIRDPKTKEARHIFNGAGALQADDTVWRVGADYATLLHTDADLDIGGLAVPKGDYTLYVDLDKGKWKLIVNKQLMDPRRPRPIWGIKDAKGTTTDDPATELGRVDMTMGNPPARVDTLKIALTRTDPPTADSTHGRLDIVWENVTASVPFTVK